MANGDIQHADVESFLSFGAAFPTAATSEGVLTENEVDGICDDINSDVNLVLRRLNITLPITDSDALNWLDLTKKWGACSIVLDSLKAQDTEEENTRSQRFWDRYMSRLEKLWESGGEILPGVSYNDDNPTTIPTQKSSVTTALRFPQLAFVTHRNNQARIRQASLPPGVGKL